MSYFGLTVTGLVVAGLTGVDDGLDGVGAGFDGVGFALAISLKSDISFGFGSISGSKLVTSLAFPDDLVEGPFDRVGLVAVDVLDVLEGFFGFERVVAPGFGSIIGSKLVTSLAFPDGVLLRSLYCIVRLIMQFRTTRQITKELAIFIWIIIIKILSFFILKKEYPTE